MVKAGVLVLDDRKRAALSKFVRSEGDTYVVDVDENGTITLTPGTFVPDFELRLHARRPDLVESISSGVAAGLNRPLVKRSHRHSHA